MKTATIILVSSFVGAKPLGAQFGLGSDIQLTTYTGASRDTSQGNVGQAFKPYRPLVVSLRPEWSFGPWRVAVGFSFSKPGIAEAGQPLTIILHDFAKLYELSPELSWRFITTSFGARGRLHGGPVVHLWQLQGEDVRSRGGAFLGVSLEFPVVTRLQVTLRGVGVFTSGVFEQSDLPSEFELRPMQRFGVGFGLRYGR